MSTRSLQFASLFVPVIVWATGTQLSQILPHVDCLSQSHWTLFASIASVFTAMAFVAAGLWYSQSGRGRAGATLGYICGFAGLLFIFALALQGAASMLVFTCER